MSINLLLHQEIFNLYSEINTKVQGIQQSNNPIEEKRFQMKTLRQEYEARANRYNQIAIKFANEFISYHKLSDHIIEAKIGSPTPYGNQPKPYLWSGVSIDRDKSYSFQYSWVFNQRELEVTFCFGSGGSSSGRLEKAVRAQRESKMRTLERRFIHTITDPQNTSILDQLIKNEGFVYTSEWLDSGNKGIQNIDEFIKKIQTQTGAKSGITRYFSREELLKEGFNLEERINRYFIIFKPIWDMLHEIDPVQSIEKTVSEDRQVYSNKINEFSTKEKIENIKSYIKANGFVYPEHLIENFYLSIKTKPFVILAGVSGTGKTKLVKLFAEALGATSDNQQFTLIPVRPDWSDPSDLMGYKDLAGVFRPGRLTMVLAEASKESNRHKPYFICLDEMNLARVEHYFSDLLSIIETQKWKDDRIVTDNLIHQESLQGNDQKLFGNLQLSDNVYLIGTVNMDETTHPFSKKVLDRANSIEFNYIDLEKYPDQETSVVNFVITPIPNDFLRNEYLQLTDVYIRDKELVQRTTKRLVQVNKILEQIHAHVGFRIRDAICFYLSYNNQFGFMSEEEAFDLQLLQKILPRVQGSNNSVKRVLLQLMEIALGRPIQVEDYVDDATEIYEGWVSISSPTEPVTYPNSVRKLAFMLRRIEEDGFTSYWLS